MAENLNRIAAGKDLVIFLAKFTELLDSQLGEVRGTIAQLVGDVMTGINQISAKTDEKKQQATAVISDTYLNPDADSKELMTNIQNSVDDVFEAAKSGISSTTPRNLVSVDTPKVAQDEDKVRRLGGHFSKHMEALTTLDDDLAKLLMEMMGALSSDDVVGQRLNHISYSIQGLKVALSYVLMDFDTRFSPNEIDKIQSDLLATTFKQYTMEDEKRLFQRIFGDYDPSAGTLKKAS